MKKIAVIAAMSKEIDLLKSILVNPQYKKTPVADFLFGTLAGNQIILVQSGIGKVCAAAALNELYHQFNPDIVLNTGAAGGLADDVFVMDVVAADMTAYYDVFCGQEIGQVQDFPRFFSADAALLKKAQELKIKTGLIASGDKFVTSKAEADFIRNIYPNALAVDMESAAIAQICFLYKLPFLCLRVISDTPGVAHHQQQYDNFWETAGEHSFQVLEKFLKLLS